jgi:hypothetical protein
MGNRQSQQDRVPSAEYRSAVRTNNVLFPSGRNVISAAEEEWHPTTVKPVVEARA